MPKIIVLMVVSGLLPWVAKANVACSGTCIITGRHFYFSFDGINPNSYREGMERCHRIPGSTEVMPVPQGSSRYMACFAYINQSLALSAVDLDEWLARNELIKNCEDKYRVGDNRGYEYTNGESRNVTCSQVNLARGLYSKRQ